MTREERIDTNEYGYDENKGIWSNYWKKFLEGYVHPSGYVRVWLKCTDGKYRPFQYHRAIWFLAYGPIPDGYEINHIREFEKTDNRLCNLELVTHKQNINYGTRNKRVAAKLSASKKGIPRPCMIEQNKRLFSKAVVALDKDNNVVYEFPSTAEAGRNGFDSSAVSECCRNCYTKQNINYYKGLRWYYKEDWEKLIYEQRETNCIAERNR